MKIDDPAAPAAHPQMRYLATALDRQIGQAN